MNAASLAGRPLAMFSASVLLVSGLVFVEAATTPSPAAAALPDGSEGFLVSHATTGDATGVDMTPDSQHVAFASTATDLVAGDTNGVSDVFLSTAAQNPADPFSGGAVLISVGLGGAPANGPSSEPTLSADGRFVAFTSAATNLVTDASTPGRTHVYVRDIEAGTTVRIQGALGEPDGHSYDADFSADGRSLVFTSDATNLDPNGNGIADDDPNGVSDVFVVDRDPDGDGTFDAVRPVFLFVGTTPLPGPSYEPAISGDGTKVVFTAEMDGVGSAGGGVATPGLRHVWRIDLSAPQNQRVMRLSRYASQPSIDSSGTVAAFTVDGVCEATGALVVASLIYNGTPYNVALGTVNVAVSVGTSSRPAVAANGETIAWQTTQAPYNYGAGGQTVLPAPVIRVQNTPSFDAWVADRVFVDDVKCGGIHEQDWADLVVGNGPSISAGGRTVAFSGPAPAPLTSAASSTVIALDRNTHEGVAVSTTMGQLAAPGMLAAINPSDIPASEIRGYASALANAPIHRIPIHRIPIHRIPIHRIPIHRIPIHRIPIHRIPIHRIPIHRIDVPGGWTELLVGTPFENQAPQTVIFGDVLDWAAKNAPDDSAATAAERAAAQRIQTLTLGDIELDNSGIDALTLGSLVLGNAKLSQVHIAGADAATDTQRWQDVVDAQGLVDDQGVPLKVTAETVLAELDFAGLDVARTGVEAVSLASLPISDTLLDTMPADSLILEGTPIGDLPVSALTETAISALWGAPRSGTIAQNAGALDGRTGTAADLARGVPPSVTFGDFLFSVIERSSFPWEQIDPASIDFIPRDQTVNTCQGGLNCQTPVVWHFAFDPAPGESTVFPSPLISLELPSGSAAAGTSLQGSGPGYSRPHSEYLGASISDGEHMEFPFADTLGGTALSLTVPLQVTTNPAADVTSATLTTGGLTDTEDFAFGRDLADYDDPRHNFDPQTGQWGVASPVPLHEQLVYYGWISTAYFRWNEDLAKNELGPAKDEDYYLVNPAPPGKRLIVSTNAADGQVVMSLYSSSDPSGSSALGVESAGQAPGTPVTEQAPGKQNAEAESGADAGVELAGQTLVDQAAVGGSGAAQVEAAGLTSADPLLLRVTSGNGLPSDSLYSIRVQYVDEPAEQVCPAVVRPLPQNRPAHGISDVIGPLTNTIYVLDSQRFDETYGAGTASALRTRLHTLDGEGVVGSGSVHGAVISVDESGDVSSARDALLDHNPCSMSARATLTTTINEFVEERIEDVRSQITSVVIVGGDDIIPLAPVAQHTSQFNEASHAADLRRAKQADGAACPLTVEVGAEDPCATPVSAAAATNHILTDDAYGLARAYESLGGRLYVPTVGVGRLVETPAQITATLARFVASEGVLDANSALAAGYGAWSELPTGVTDALDWRATVNNLGDSWTASQATALLTPAGDNALSPRVISLNAHADESRLLPGVPGAAAGKFVDADLLNAASLANAPQLAGALVFTIGCHAGGNLPTAYYGDVPDWVDVFSAAGGYVGNTGYGLASSTTTALSERLLALYADWIGVDTPNGPVSSAGALTYAKQSYLGGFGLYSGYDEKALMESVYYGLPMYTFKAAAEPKAMPVPVLPPNGFSQLPVTGPGLSAASLSLSPEFRTSIPDASGASHLIAGDWPFGQPAPTFQPPLTISGQPVLPSLVYRLDTAPEHMKARGALITQLSSAVQNLRPTIAQASVGVDAPPAAFAGRAFPSVFAQVLHQLTPGGTIDTLAVTPGRVETDVNGLGRAETFTQMGIDVIYGSATSADDIAPIIRSTDLDGSWLDITADGTGSPITKGLLLVQAEGADGSTGGAWTPIPVTFTDDEPAPAGEDDTTYVSSAEVQIPVGNGNPFRWFLQVVDAAGNVAIDTSRGRLAVGAAAPPKLTEIDDVMLTAGDRMLRTIEVTNAKANDELTAKYTITDPTGTSDRGGAALVQVGPDGTTRVIVDEVLSALGEFVASIEVCAGKICTTTTFHVTVEPVKAMPTITAHPTNADGAYAVDTWSRTAVTVKFECAAGSPLVPIATCPESVVVSPDTSASGEFVERTASDQNGTTASVGLRVKVDATKPALAPVVSPAILAVGDEAVAAPHASDEASGIASASCEQPDTSAPGVDQTVLCTATDKAGNTETATATYTVNPSPPKITASAVNSGGVYAEGTWSRSAVTVSFECTGGAAPIWCPEDQTVSADTDGIVIEGEMRSGTFDTVVATTRFAVKIDGTAPTLSPVVTPSPVLQHQPAAVAANATDRVSDTVAGSGVLTPSISCTPAGALDTSKVGIFPVSCTATDNAGNTADPVTVNYTVVAPTPVTPKCRTLLDRTALAPVYADGSSVFLRTSGVPVIFTACDSKGNPIGTKKFVTKVTLVSTATLTARTINELWYPPIQPFSYVKQLGVWTGHIPTAKLAGGKKYTYQVHLSDGTSFTVTFGVR